MAGRIGLICEWSESHQYSLIWLTPGIDSSFNIDNNTICTIWRFGRLPQTTRLRGKQVSFELSPRHGVSLLADGTCWLFKVTSILTKTTWMIQADLPRILMIAACPQMCIITRETGVWWHMVACGGTWWRVVARVGMWWHVVACGGM